MNYRVKNKIIDAICKGKNLFIKDTGIEVMVEYLGTDLQELRVRGRSVGSKDFHCSVLFVTPPTVGVLKLFKKYDIIRNSHSQTVEAKGNISIEHLSLIPYEGKAGKLLYGKKKQ